MQQAKMFSVEKLSMVDFFKRLRWQACDALAAADGHPVLVVAGDTLLKADFSLHSFVQRYEEGRATLENSKPRIIKFK